MIIHLFFTVSSLKEIKLNGLKLLLCRDLPTLDVQVEEDKILTACIFYICNFLHVLEKDNIIGLRHKMEYIVDDVKQE